MSAGYEVVDEDHVGGQEQVESEWKTIRAVFHNFPSLPSERGDSACSAVLQCHGLKWKIIIYPGGSSISSEKEVFVSIFLGSMNTKTIKAQAKFRIPSAGTSKGGKSWDTFAPIHSNTHESGTFKMWGQAEYGLRSSVLNPRKKYIVGGNLTVEVDIRVMLDKQPTWTPTNTVCSDMLKILDSADAENADVAFEVSSGDEKELFNAHSLILTARCTALSELTKGAESGAPIPIDGVHPDIFRMILRFVYGGEVPSDNILEVKAKAIVDAANKYGCTGLKLAAEAKLSSAGITTDNAAELILFADGTNCAMLKEAAMDYFVKNIQAVMSSDGYEQVAESPAIMREMMAAMAEGSKKRPASSDGSDDGDRDYKRMRVATLRQKLDEKGLDVDGSKEMLVSRLEEAEKDVIEVE